MGEYAEHLRGRLAIRHLGKGFGHTAKGRSHFAPCCWRPER